MAARITRTLSRYSQFKTFRTTLTLFLDLSELQNESISYFTLKPSIAVFSAQFDDADSNGGFGAWLVEREA